MRTTLASLVLATVFSLALVSPASAQDFPLRAKYPQEVFISTADLASSKDKMIVVDARDQTEYNVLHIEGARLLPVETMRADDLKALRPDGDTRRIVFYCNGGACEKSYKASAKAALWDIPNTVVYDAGVFAWAKAHPDKSLFFDKPLTEDALKSSLIPETALAAVCLDLATFKARTSDPSYTIYDLRERSDRSAKPVTFRNDNRLVLDAFVAALEKGTIPKSKLLVYDNVGKQVMWLQYYLNRYGITEYYFLKGGVQTAK